MKQPTQGLAPHPLVFLSEKYRTTDKDLHAAYLVCSAQNMAIHEAVTGKVSDHVYVCVCVFDGGVLFGVIVIITSLVEKRKRQV